MELYMESKKIHLAQNERERKKNHMKSWSKKKFISPKMYGMYGQLSSPAHFHCLLIMDGN